MRIVSTAAATMRHSFGAVAEALLAAAIIAALLLALAPVYQPADFLAGTEQAAAAKGGNGHRAGGKPGADGGSLAVVMVYDRNADGQPNWYDTSTFAVSTTATDKPWVTLTCAQGGAAVYSMTAGFFPAYPWPANYTLASTQWTSGGADCTATLYMIKSNGRHSTLATLSFSVGA